MPTYAGGIMLLGWASDDDSWLALSREVLEQRRSAVLGKMQYYSPAIHQAALVLPVFVEEEIEKVIFSSQ
jgi:spermidine synthase